MTLTKKPAAWLFAVTAILVYSVVYFETHTPQAISHAALMSAAALFDLSVTMSIACYVFLARNGCCSWRVVMAVGLCGLRAGGFLLPEVDQQYVPSLRWVSVLLELLVVATLVRRFRRVQLNDDDVLARIRGAVSAIFPYKRLAGLIAAEAAILYYALFSWRVKPETNRNAQAFSYGEASGYNSLGTLLALLILCEGVPLHFLLSHYNAVIAWIWTGLDIYGLLWAVAMIRASKLRVILVDEQWVKVRAGIIWEAEIPRKHILSCQRVSSAETLAKTPDYLKMVMLNDPQYILQLSQPVVAVGFYGQRRMFTQMGIAIDQGEAFVSALGLNS